MKFLAPIGASINRHPTITDGMIALVLSGLALLQLSIYWELRQPVAVPPTVAIALTLLIILPLTWRRRFPLAVMVIMTVLLLVHRYFEIPEGNFTGNSLLLGLLSAAAFGGKWRTWVCGVTYAVIMGYATYGTIIADLSDFEGNQVLFRVMALIWTYFIFGAAWWFGSVMRSRREREAELEERKAQLERERVENARRAVLDERVRIARELHDVVAHHVSVMGVQAGAARHVLKQQPEKAQEALSSIETSSRQAVGELQRLLGFLRQESQPDKLSPQPSLRQLDALVSEMQEAELAIEVKIEGKKQPLPPGVDLSAYRIVQEALTNVLKHAGPATAKVTIRYTNNAIELQILDNGRGFPPIEGQDVNGNGIIGMRERVSLHNGKFEAGNNPEGGFFVKAKLPLQGGML